MTEPNLKNEESELANKWGDEILPTGSRFIPLTFRIVIWLYGIVMPIICHLLTISGPLDAPEWQSGSLSDKLGFVLCLECGWPMLPLLAFPMFCLAQVLLDEKRATQSWVRFGVFTGVPVTAWYMFVFGGASPAGFFGLLTAGTVSAAIIYGLCWGLPILRKRIPYESGVLVIGTFILLLLIFVLTRGLLLAFPVVFSLVFATPLAFLVYLGMSIRIFRVYRFNFRYSVAELLAATTWLGALFAAIRESIALSFAEYSKLPLEPPQDCYVATAAAQGYPLIVGSRELQAVTEEPVFVNQQLTTFKIAELALRTVSPIAHRVFRFVYNRIGPRMAALLHSPIAATLAYISLKPAEWICRFTLRIVLGRELLQRASNIYFERAKSS